MPKELIVCCTYMLLKITLDDDNDVFYIPMTSTPTYCM